MNRSKKASADARVSGKGSAVAAALARELRPDALGLLVGCLEKQWKSYRKGLKRCQREFSEPAVHDSRVQTRRLLSMLELLGPFLGGSRLEKARSTLKRHLDTFDDLRDTHVQLLTTAGMTGRFEAATEFRAYLRKREKRFTRRTRKDIRRVRTRRLSKLVSALCDEVSRSYPESTSRDSRPILLKALRDAFARTLQLFRKIDPGDTSTIHRTRVAFKRYRYMVEVMVSLLPVSHPALLKAMHDYQTLMGDIQDAEMLLQTFDKFRVKKKIQNDSGEQMRNKLSRRRQSLIRKYLSRADKFLDFRPGRQAATSRPPGLLTDPRDTGAGPLERPSVRAVASTRTSP